MSSPADLQPDRSPSPNDPDEQVHAKWCRAKGDVIDLFRFYVRWVKASPIWGPVILLVIVVTLLGVLWFIQQFVVPAIAFGAAGYGGGKLHAVYSVLKGKK